MTLQRDLQRIAEKIESPREDEEAGAARDDRKQDEDREIIAEQAADDRDEFVGYRREALEQDNQRAPARVSLFQRGDAVAIAIGVDQPLADRVIEQSADRIAKDTASHGGDGADGRIAPGALRPRERHRHEDQIRRNREKRAFRKSDNRQRRRGARRFGKRQDPLDRKSVV